MFEIGWNGRLEPRASVPRMAQGQSRAQSCFVVRDARRCHPDRNPDSWRSPDSFGGSRTNRRPLVVLLSPFPESILSFVGSWETLTKELHVIALDLPGFGASEGDHHDMSPAAIGDHLAAIFTDPDLRDIHLVGSDVGMGAALAYVLNHEHRLLSMAVGHGSGAPGPFKLARMINMLVRFGFMRTTTALLGAGPLLAFSYELGTVRHQPNATQIDDFKQAYSGRAAEVVHWFKDFRAKAKEIADRVHRVDIPTLVFWGEFDVMFDPSNAEFLAEAVPKSKLQILPDAGHFSWAD